MGVGCAIVNVGGAIAAVVLDRGEDPFSTCMANLELTILIGFAVLLLCRITMLRYLKGWKAVPSLDLTCFCAKQLGSCSALAMLGPIRFMLKKAMDKKREKSLRWVAISFGIGGVAFMIIGAAALKVKIDRLYFVHDVMVSDWSAAQVFVFARMVLSITSIEKDWFTLCYPAGVRELMRIGVSFTDSGSNEFRDSIFASISETYGGVHAALFLVTMTAEEAEQLIFRKNPTAWKRAHPCSSQFFVADDAVGI